MVREDECRLGIARLESYGPCRWHKISQPTAEGILPNKADTSDPAWTKRKILSTNNLVGVLGRKRATEFSVDKWIFILNDMEDSQSISLSINRRKGLTNRRSREIPEEVVFL
ncbi:hypothetical protein E3N88_24664 [Mikania micrantha]|uniref:Uncharacterized protein n=1 Tax=Mikania micrantha TaxID=192012 RepID=A0A5N6N3X7_9ASTR|nr:hypothetical protein E3N88_24664 [Mikania micrantha]